MLHVLQGLKQDLTCTTGYGGRGGYGGDYGGGGALPRSVQRDKALLCHHVSLCGSSVGRIPRIWIGLYLIRCTGTSSAPQRTVTIHVSGVHGDFRALPPHGATMNNGSCRKRWNMIKMTFKWSGSEHWFFHCLNVQAPFMSACFGYCLACAVALK